MINTPTQPGWYWVRPLGGGEWIAVAVEDSIPAGRLHLYVPSTTGTPDSWWRPIDGLALDWGPRIPEPDESDDRQILPTRSNWELTWSPFSRRPYRPEGRIVICRLKWETGTRMTPGWHDNKLSLSLCHRMFQLEWGRNDRIATLFGIRIHHLRAFGGHFPRRRSSPQPR